MNRGVSVVYYRLLMMARTGVPFVLWEHFSSGRHDFMPGYMADAFRLVGPSGSLALRLGGFCGGLGSGGSYGPGGVPGGGTGPCGG